MLKSRFTLRSHCPIRLRDECFLTICGSVIVRRFGRRYCSDCDRDDIDQDGAGRFWQWQRNNFTREARAVPALPALARGFRRIGGTHMGSFEWIGRCWISLYVRFLDHLRPRCHCISEPNSLLLAPEPGDTVSMSEYSKKKDIGGRRPGGYTKGRRTQRYSEQTRGVK